MTVSVSTEKQDGHLKKRAAASEGWKWSHHLMRAVACEDEASPGSRLYCSSRNGFLMIPSKEEFGC